MNQSSKIASIAAGLSLLAVGALAQSTPPATGSTPYKSTTPSAAQSSNPSAAQATPRSSSTMNSTISADHAGIDAAQFKSMDTDGDGRISRSEFMSHQSEGNTGAANDAGKDEKKHWWNRKSADAKSTDTGLGEGQNSLERFNQLDTNKDGFLSQQELAAQPGSDLKK